MKRIRAQYYRFCIPLSATVFAALTLVYLLGISPSALAAVDYGAFGSLDTRADGGTSVSYSTSAGDQLLSDEHEARTNGSDSNTAEAKYHGSLLTGILGTRTYGHRPGLNQGEATTNASANIKIFDSLTFTIPVGEYADDLYAVLHGTYQGYVGASGNYGTYASQTIEVMLQYERFYKYFLDHGDEGLDGFYSGDITLSTKLLTGPVSVTTPIQTSRQVSAYLYSGAGTLAYVKNSAENADSDFADTVQILSIEVPDGVTWTSASGVFLSVPEPNSVPLALAALITLWLLSRILHANRQPWTPQHGTGDLHFGLPEPFYCPQCGVQRAEREHSD